MKITFTRNLGITTALVAAIGAYSVRANTAGTTPQNLGAVSQSAQTETIDFNEGEHLVDAYRHLSRADHDYDGHRKHAMEAVEAAGHELGINPHGDGHGFEHQGISDENLRLAKSDLQDVRKHLFDRGEKKTLAHVDKAIEEINLALDKR